MKKFTKEWGKLYLGALSFAKGDVADAGFLEKAEEMFMQNAKDNEIIESRAGQNFCTDDFCEERLFAIQNEAGGTKLVFGNGKEMIIESANFIENDIDTGSEGKESGFYVLLACELYYTDKYEVHLLFYDGESGDALKYITITGNKISRK